jgi:hypothetical protein
MDLFVVLSALILVVKLKGTDLFVTLGDFGFGRAFK